MPKSIGEISPSTVLYSAKGVRTPSMSQASSYRDSNPLAPVFMRLLRYAAARTFFEKQSAGKHFLYRCRHSFYGRGSLRSPWLTLGDSVPGTVLRSPCRHQLENRLQTLPVTGQRIFHLGRHNGVHFAVDDLVALQLP